MDRPRRTVSVAAVVVGLLGLMLVAPTAGSAAVREASGFATGTVLHADLLRSGDTRLADLEVGFSGSSFDAGGLTDDLLNEMGRRFSERSDGKSAFGRGAGLELGLGSTPEAENQLILAGTAQQSSPPRLSAVLKEIGPADLAPLAWASALKGEAGAHTTQNPCALGIDASRGLGEVADLQLLETGSEDLDRGLSEPVLALDATDQVRDVSTSRSGSQLVAQRDLEGKLIGDAFGIMSETRQTIAPITLFRDTPNELTIEVLGEWVLQAVATGIQGNSFVHYGPDAESPQTIVARIIPPEGEPILVTQDLLGEEGLVVPIPGLAEIAIGEPARAIGGEAGSSALRSADGTQAAAAADVVRVRLLTDAPAQIADLRVGHMEARSEVPAGGVDCPIPVTKSPTEDSVAAGDTFGMNFEIANPYDCTLQDVNLSDVVTTEGAARFEVISTRPATAETLNGALSNGTLAWPNIGTIEPGKTKAVFAEFAARGGSGRIVDTANATAKLADCAQEGATVAGVDLAIVGNAIEGLSTLVREPAVETKVLAASGDTLPRTGASILTTVLSGLALLGLGGAGIAISRRFK